MISRFLPRRFRPGRQPLDEGGGSQVNLERVGRSRIDDMAASTRKVPWTLTLLQLLWTAGPVTFLAMQGGSYLGYGEPASVATYIFFAIYVVLAATIGLIARVAADAIRGNRQARARANITRTLDMAPDLMFTLRDLHLATLPDDQRQREAAFILLGKLDVGSSSIAMAVEDLTGDRELAEIAQRIEIYRRAGMHSRVEDWVRHSAARRELAIAAFRGSSPLVFQALEQRLQGIAPSQETGIPRNRNFIARIFTAAHYDDLSLMSLTDVEELLLLTFELLSDRRITRLTIDYAGDWKLARVLDQMERTQNEYRQVRASAQQRLHDFNSLLTETGLLSPAPDTAGMSPDQRLAQANAELGQRLAESTGRHSALARDAVTREALRRALRYAKLTRQAIDRLQESYRAKVRALKVWERLRRRQLPATAAGNGTQRRQGLLIRESTIALEDDQKLALTEGFCRYLDEMQITKGSQGILQRGEPLRVDKAKRLGIHLALILEPLVELANPAVQRAIDSSNGIFLEGLEIGFSADAKVGLGTASAKEIQENLGPAAELIATRLTQLYHLPLTESMINFLCNNYSADRQRLEYLGTSARHTRQLGDVTASPADPPHADLYEQWRQPVRRIERVLGRLLR